MCLNFSTSYEKANRVVFGRKCIEVCVQGDLEARNHSLDPLFDCRDTMFKQKPKKKKKSNGDEEDDDEDERSDDENMDDDGIRNIERPLVVCNDPQDFLYGVMMDRNMDPEETMVKIGLDDGQSIFKVTAQLVTPAIEEDTKGKRDKYAEVIFQINRYDF